jgi:WD40 repeat protein
MLVHRIAFSPDGKRIASASSDRTINICDAGLKQEVEVYYTPPPDHKRLPQRNGNGLGN